MKRIFISILIVLCLVLTMTVVFTACGGDDEPTVQEPVKIDPVNAETVKYDGDRLTWSEIAHAEAYYVYLDDSEEYYTVYQPEFILTLSRDVKFSILSVAQSRDYTSATEKAVVEYKYLPKVEAITIQKRTTDKLIGQNYQSNQTSFDYFVFDAVEGAEYYDLYENGSEEARRFQPEEGDTVIKQPIGATFGTEGGTASLSVMPRSTNERTYSHISATKTVKVLSDPTNFNYDDDARMISWRNIAGASYTEIKIGTELDSIEKPTVIATNYYVFNTSDRNFKMEVKAIGNLDNDVLDSRLVTRSFRELPMLEGLTVEYGNLRWSPSTETNRYQVKLSVGLVDLSGNDYVQSIANVTLEGCNYPDVLKAYPKTIKEQGIDKQVPCTYTAYVRPIIDSSEDASTVSYAAWSKLEFGLLDTPVIEYTGNNTITWQQVSSAVSYKIFYNYQNCEYTEFTGGVNIEERDLIEGNEKQYLLKFDRGAGIYCVRIAALASNEKGMSGVFSSPKSEPFYVVVLDKPRGYSVVDNKYDKEVGVSQSEELKNDGVTIFFNSVYGANSYQATGFYYQAYKDNDADGIPDSVSDESLSLPISKITDYTDDENARYQHSVDLLYEDVPDITTISLDANGRVDYLYLWATSGFMDGSYVTWDAANYKFVAAESSNTIIMNGNEAQEVEITHLAAPKNVKVDNDSGLLTFDSVARASGYYVKVVCDSNPELSFCKKIYNNYFKLDFVTPGVYTVSVKACGNSNIFMDSIYNGEQSVIRLPEVTNLSVNYDNDTGATFLEWDTPVLKYNDRTFNPTGFDIYIGNQVYNYTQENNVVNNRYLITDAMKEFLSSNGTICTITAVGRKPTQDDPVNILDSAQSISITIFKLDRPKALTVNGAALSFGMVDNATCYRIFNGDTYVGMTYSTTWSMTRSALGIYDYDYHELQLTVRASRGKTLNEQGEETDIGYGNSYYNLQDNSTRSFFIDSEKSGVLAVTLLDAPKVKIAENTGTAKWAAVKGASSYLVKVKEMNTQSLDERNYFIEAIPGQEVAFTPTILSAPGTEVHVSITAVGNNLDYINSFPFAYTTVVEKLSMPNVDDKGNYFTIEQVDENEDGVIEAFKIIIADAKSESPTQGSGYYIHIGSNDEDNGGVDLFASKSGVYVMKNVYPGPYTFSICAAGGNYKGEVLDLSDSNTIYVNSDYSPTQTIYVLAAPNADDILVSKYENPKTDEEKEKIVVRFKAIDQAASYRINYTYKTFGDAVNIDDPVTFNKVKSDHIEFDVKSPKEGVAYVENGFVCFVLDGVAADKVNVVDLLVIVKGDGVQSVANASSIKAYDVN